MGNVTPVGCDVVKFHIIPLDIWWTEKYNYIKHPRSFVKYTEFDRIKNNHREEHPWTSRYYLQTDFLKSLTGMAEQTIYQFDGILCHH